MKVSISKSVGRAFEVMEIFKELRKPASATEIRQKINGPHSSVVAVLHNLADLGYLTYDTTTRLYFPTQKFGALGTWVKPALQTGNRLRELAEAIALETGQTASITCRNSIFLNIVCVVRGSHISASEFSTGIGMPLCRSIPGLALLSQMSNDAIVQIVAQTERWASKSGVAQSYDAGAVVAAVDRCRAVGAAIDFDTTLPGIGAIAYPISSPFDGSPLAISVSGPAKRIKATEKLIREVVEHYVRCYKTRTTEAWPSFIRNEYVADARSKARFAGAFRSAAPRLAPEQHAST